MAYECLPNHCDGTFEKCSIYNNQGGALVVKGGNWNVALNTILPSSYLGLANSPGIFSFEQVGLIASAINVWGCIFNSASVSPTTNVPPIHFLGIGIAQVSYSNFSKNFASTAGAVVVIDCQIVNLWNCQFTGNSATQAGAIYANNVPSFRVKQSQFQDNIGVGASDISLDGKIEDALVEESSFSGGNGTNILVRSPSFLSVSQLTFFSLLASGAENKDFLAVDCIVETKSDKLVVQFDGDDAVTIDGSIHNTHSDIGSTCTLEGAPRSQYSINWIIIGVFLCLIVVAILIAAGVAGAVYYKKVHKGSYQSIEGLFRSK